MANDTTIDWAAALADVEARIAKLQITADGIRDIIAAGGGAAGGSTPGGGGGGGIKPDTFLKMSIPDATKKLLEMTREKKSTQEVMDALEKGGLPPSKYNTVYSILSRRASQVPGGSGRPNGLDTVQRLRSLPSLPESIPSVNLPITRAGPKKLLGSRRFSVDFPLRIGKLTSWSQSSRNRRANDARRAGIRATSPSRKSVRCASRASGKPPSGRRSKPPPEVPNDM